MASNIIYPGREKFFHTFQKIVRARNLIIATELAYRLAKVAHANQKRDSGERYFDHVKAVAWIIIYELIIEAPKRLTIAVVAALLHDLLEDTYAAEEEHLRFIFDKIDPLMTTIIGELTKPDDAKSHEEKWYRLLNSREKLTKIVKGADRLHNVRSLTTCGSIAKMKKIVKETEEIILPWLEKDQQDKNILYLIQAIGNELEDVKAYIEKNK